MMQVEQQPVQHAAAAAGAGERQHCMYFHPRKRRYCGFQRKPGTEYCGNHLHLFVSSGEERVPCPANPAHDVPKSELLSHIFKCPKAIAIAATRAQPYFAENMNSGHPSVSISDFLQQQQQQGQGQQQQHSNFSGDFSSSSSCTAYLKGLLDPADPMAAQAAAIAAEAAAPFLRGAAARRQAAAVALGPEGFAALMLRVGTAHAALSQRFPLVRRLLGGTERVDCDPAAVSEALREFSLGLDPMMPFDAKHVVQHASLVGNMAAAGLLSDPQRTLFLELGAGKGFLTAWLHQVCGAAELLLLDILGNFARKADRRLRFTCLTRVSVDLKDAALLPLMALHLQGDVRVQAWHQTQRQFRVDGLQRKRQKQQLKQQQQQEQKEQKEQQQQQQQEQQPGGQEQWQQQPDHEQQQERQHVQVDVSKQDSVAEEHEDEKEQQQQQQQQQQHKHHTGQQQQQRRRQFRQPKPRSEADMVVSGGLCCCPDRLQQPYPAPLPDIYLQQQQLYPQQLLFSKQQQQQQQQLQPEQQKQQAAVIPWVAHGKHLCGAATDFALRACFNAVKQQELMLLQQQQQASTGVGNGAAKLQQQELPQQQVFDFRGLAIATCCHQKSGWSSFVAKRQLAAVGISAEDFEIIAWMTSWALCGHEAPPGSTEEVQEDPDAPGQQPAVAAAAAAASSGSAAAPSAEMSSAGAAATLKEADGSPINNAQPTAPAAPAPTAAAVGDAEKVGDAAAGDAAAGDAAVGSGSAADDFHPADVMSRSQRMAFGMKCKQLLDAARCAWIHEELLPAVELLQQLQQQQQTLIPVQSAADESSVAASSSGSGSSSKGGLSIARLSYTDLSVTGENTLLLLGGSLGD